MCICIVCAHVWYMHICIHIYIRAQPQAKDLREEGDRLENEAKKDVSTAAKLREKAEKMRETSDKEKEKFVSEERPVELANKLADHDHRQYRKDELAVAQDVTALSEHPMNKKLRATVDQ
jgi:hypothetical protein